MAGSDDEPKQGISMGFTFRAGGPEKEEETSASTKGPPNAPAISASPSAEDSELLGEPELNVLVCSELLPGLDHSTVAAQEPLVIPLDSRGVDGALDTAAPQLAIEVSDPIDPRGRPLRVDLCFRKLRDFAPSRIVEQVPALRGLVQAREVLLHAQSSGHARALSDLKRILAVPEWAEALLADVGGADGGRTAGSPQTLPSPAPTSSETSDAASGDSALDRLLSQVDVAATAVPAPEPKKGGGMSALIARAAGRPTAAGGGGAGVSRLEQAFSQLLRAILEHPEVHRLEASWRGLGLMLKHGSHRATKVFLLAAPPAQWAAALEEIAGDANSQIDLIVVDDRIGAAASDLKRLESWGAFAERIAAPIISNAEPSVVGANTLDDLSGATRAFSLADDPEAVALRAVSSRDTARWICLGMNGPLLRSAYDKKTARLDLPFEQPTADVRTKIFCPPCFAIASFVLKSFTEHGHPFSPVDPRSGKGVLEDMAVHMVSDRGHEVALPTEAYITRDTQHELAKTGLAVLGAEVNRDRIIVEQIPVLFRGADAGKGGTAPSKSTLADQLFVGRLSRAVIQLGAALPRGVDSERAKKIVSLALGQFFASTGVSGPQFETQISGTELSVTLWPRRYAGLKLEEFGLSVPLGGGY